MLATADQELRAKVTVPLPLWMVVIDPRYGVSDRVAETIERALSARRMRARYLIGRDAHAMVWASRLLPDLLFDRLLRRAVGV